MAAQLKMRVAELNAVRMLIEDLQAKIGYAAMDIPSILFSLKSDKQYIRLVFMKGWAEGVKRGEPIVNALESAFEEVGTGHFGDGDKEVLLSFAARLGTSNVDGQIKLCRLYSAELTRQLEFAKSDYTQKGKLYRTLGLFCGLFIIIFFV
jgi:stage III sporulation protein AB